MKKVTAYAREKAMEKGKRVAFSITTNGSLITDEIISFLKEEKINPTISFDGPPAYHNRQRPFKDGSGSYDKVYANVQKLRAVFPNLAARATVHDDADPFRIKEGLKQAGFTSYSLIKSAPVILNSPFATMPAGPLEENKWCNECWPSTTKRPINCLPPFERGRLIRIVRTTCCPS